jgi:tetrahydromethanopterin S-methyltransferase subunit G
VQTTQPRDIGILTMVIGLFVILFVVALLVGPPATFG